MDRQKCLAVIGAFLSLIQNISSQDLFSSGATISLGDIAYYISDKPFASGYESIYTASAATSKGAVFGLLPVTVLNLGPAVFSPGTIERSVVSFEEQDDVWSKAFLSGKESGLKQHTPDVAALGINGN